MAENLISNQLVILLAVNYAALFLDNWSHTRHSQHFCEVVSIYYINNRPFLNFFSLMSQFLSLLSPCNSSGFSNPSLNDLDVEVDVFS
ncbi:Uncharacterised protein [Vibrio cholerae]|nr:Uncharacterised protein [Vibrio cholerae]CSB40505.1 Uncharacterised protein [Vibrio cholerae]CSB52247.1 Uncharacterised protein [Vibrio cholerae]